MTEFTPTTGRTFVEELQALDGFRESSRQEQQVLLAAALLHDIEKRSTTLTEADGRISSPGHARKGAFTARALLYRTYPAPFAVRESIAGLVRYHGLPLWVFEKPDPVKALLQASLEVDTRLLALLARSDVRGRQCADRDELEYRVDLFEEFCREQGCFGKPRPFANNLARFHYFNSEERYPDYVPFDDRRAEVVILSGLPGAGKDTYIRRRLPDWPVLSLDELRRELRVKPTDSQGTGHAVQLARERARTHLRRGERFVWNATNLTRMRRGSLIELFAGYGARVHLIYLETPYETLLRQNADREAAVPVSVIDRMIDRLEPPSPVEAHEVTWAAS